MSQLLISLSPELKKLRDEGFGVDVRSGCLIVDPLPFLDTDKKLRSGKLIVKLNLSSPEKLAGTVEDHTTRFAGQIPCDLSGTPMTFLVAATGDQELAGVMTHHTFSRKPLSGKYANYYELVTTYAGLICGPAEELHEATSRSFPVVGDSEEASVFQYTDTASSRAEIEPITRKLMGHRVAIIGLGGTGSYVLDLIAKTPVAEIHLFDGDVFLLHNAFRAPGAPSKGELEARPKKVDYLHGSYSQMHRHIIPHDYFVTGANVNELSAMSFAFLCADRVADKKAVIEFLEKRDIPFVDVGMGVSEVSGALTGMLRTTLSTPATREAARPHIPLVGDDENDYSKNIQIADLNSLNAALAVIRWKRLCGFYADVTMECDSMYKVSSNVLVNTAP